MYSYIYFVTFHGQCQLVMLSRSTPIGGLTQVCAEYGINLSGESPVMGIYCQV